MPRQRAWEPLTGPAFAATDKTATDAETQLEKTAILPILVAAVTSALAIGTPIALLRCQAKEMKRNQIITPLMVASIPGESLRVLGTVGKGLINSADTAFSAWYQPFTPKSFSLEELDR